MRVCVMYVDKLEIVHYLLINYGSLKYVIEKNESDGTRQL
jgi:hypothetical protein